MAADGIGSSKRRERQGQEGTESSDSDRPPKIAKSLIVEGERNVVAFKMSKRAIASIEKYGGTADGFHVIDYGDSVDIVSVGKLLDFKGIVWMARHGFNSTVKREDGKLVVHSPPCTITFLKKELDEMSVKQIKFILRMSPINTLLDALAKAGSPCKKVRHSLEERIKQQELGDEDDESRRMQATETEQNQIWETQRLLLLLLLLLLLDKELQEKIESGEKLYRMYELGWMKVTIGDNIGKKKLNQPVQSV